MSKLMTNLLPVYARFLQKEAGRTKKTKREILERAIDLYMREVKKQQIMAQYKKMGQDKDYLEKTREETEMGMEYFLSDIENENEEV